MNCKLIKNIKFKKKFLVVILVLIAVLLFFGGIFSDRYFDLKFLDKYLPKLIREKVETKLVKEESVVIDIAEKVSPSVVTISIKTPQRRVLQFNPFGGGISSRIEGGEDTDIGSGFIVSKDGLIVTNKHVVSSTSGTYKVITKDDKEYDVIEISKDPVNDIAVIKIDANNLTPLELGDSSNLKVGQFVIAIGTALGEFRHTVTTGVISGLGRGITAGSAYEGYVEKLDDVIQTDAAINPGNSGGPLLNSSGEVIGINVAVAEGANNIGFALPVDILNEALRQFNQNGEFSKKAYLGIEYQFISKESAILNSVPQGAYVVGVVLESPAQKAGIKEGDIIVKINNIEVTEENGGLSKIISDKKPGEMIDIELYRNEETQKVKVVLSEFAQ